jgi:hypothetical protein
VNEEAELKRRLLVWKPFRPEAELIATIAVRNDKKMNS